MDRHDINRARPPQLGELVAEPLGGGDRQPHRGGVRRGRPGPLRVVTCRQFIQERTIMIEYASGKETMIGAIKAHIVGRSRAFWENVSNLQQHLILSSSRWAKRHALRTKPNRLFAIRDKPNTPVKDLGMNGGQLEGP